MLIADAVAQMPRLDAARVASLHVLARCRCQETVDRVRAEGEAKHIHTALLGSLALCFVAKNRLSPVAVARVACVHGCVLCTQTTVHNSVLPLAALQVLLRWSRIVHCTVSITLGHFAARYKLCNLFFSPKIENTAEP